MDEITSGVNEDSCRDIGGLLNDSAVVSMKQGQLHKAQKQLKRAKSMAERAHRPNLVLLTATNANLGELHCQRGDFKTAEAHLRVAATWLSKLDTSDSAHSVSSAVVHGNLGRVRLFRESFAEARHLLEHAAQSSTSLERHPVHAKCLSNLALLHVYQHNTVSALGLFRRARTWFRQAVGYSNIETVICLNNLGSVATLEEARVIYQRCGVLLSRFDMADHRVKACRDAVARNAAILQRVKDEVRSNVFAPQNLVEALQVGYGPENQRLQLLSHCNHIMGIGVPSSSSPSAH